MFPRGAVLLRSIVCRILRGLYRALCRYFRGSVIGMGIGQGFRTANVSALSRFLNSFPLIGGAECGDALGQETSLEVRLH
jgi:hypothetical protein